MGHLVRRRPFRRTGPRSTAWRRTAGLLLAIAAVTSCTQSGELHALIETNSVVTVGFSDFSGTSDGAAGLFVCATGPGVDLESVEPLDIEDSAEPLGAVELSGTAEEDGIIGASYGFPPEHVSHDALGTKAVAECNDTSVTQVVVGARRTATTGGAIRGTSITYRLGGHRRTLEVPNFHISLCGD
ncbi:MAG TPA: hypothetical protein ENK10_08175, partial [Acidobacteria bacterium]|nr:hypothetical protein [Acidobacteriota bacterium]